MQGRRADRPPSTVAAPRDVGELALFLAAAVFASGLRSLMASTSLGMPFTYVPLRALLSGADDRFRDDRDPMR